MITIHKFLWHWIKIWPLRGSTYMAFAEIPVTLREDKNSQATWSPYLQTYPAIWMAQEIVPSTEVHFGVVGHLFLGRHGLTEGKITAVSSTEEEVSAGTVFLLRWRMACRGTDACDPTCSAISSAALIISSHVVVSGSFLQPCNHYFTTATSYAAWTRSQFFSWICFDRGSKA